MAKITMNETRKKVLEVLRVNKENGGKPMTLSQIAQAIGVDKINSGTTNALIANGIINKMGTTKVQVTTFREVETYALGEVTLEDLEKAEKESKTKA